MQNNSLLTVNVNTRKKIDHTLAQIASDHNITILFALESGSRGWGFASPDSDYDIRFIYAHSTEWYLSVLQQPEDIDLFLDNGNLDLNAWDIRKVLRLLLKSNATPFEWIQSPIVYHQHPKFKEMFWALAQQHFQAKASMLHYLGLAQNSFRKGLVSDYEINLKKYFYVLRPLFAAMWIADKGTIPPMTFSDLQAVLATYPNIKLLVDDLWSKKLQASEEDNTRLLPELVNFIEDQLIRCYTIADALPAKKYGPEKVNAFFQKVLSNLN